MSLTLVSPTKIDSPAGGLTAAQVAQINYLLASRVGPVRNTALAVLAYSLGTGAADVSSVRRHLLALPRLDPDLRATVSDTQQWHQLLTLARKHDADSSSQRELVARSLSLARRGAARALTPIAPGSLPRGVEVNCRAVIALAVEQQLALGFDNLLLTEGFLATRLNLSVPTVRRLLKVLEHDLKWIRRIGKKRGALVWKLTQLKSSAPDADWSWLHAAAVNEWAARDMQGASVAAVLASVSHPAWHHAVSSDGSKALGVRAWLALLHERAGHSDEVTMGMPLAVLRRTKRELRDLVSGVLEGTLDLQQALDGFAAANGASGRRAVRELEFTAAAVARRAEVDRVRRERSMAFDLRTEALAIFREAFHVDRLGPAPTGTREHPDVGATLEDWTVASARYYAAHAASTRPELVPVLRAMVTKLVIGAGHSEARADKVVVFMLPIAVAAV